MHACIMYVCVYVCMCGCIYIYVYIHTFGVPWWFQHCFTTPAITSVSVNMLNHTWIPSTFLLKVKWGAIIWVTSCPKIRVSPKRRSPTNKHVFFTQCLWQIWQTYGTYIPCQKRLFHRQLWQAGIWSSWGQRSRRYHHDAPVMSLYAMKKYLKTYHWLVVERLWKIWKSLGVIIPNMWKNNNCSKPPTSLGRGCSSYSVSKHSKHDKNVESPLEKPRLEHRPSKLTENSHEKRYQDAPCMEYLAKQ